MSVKIKQVIEDIKKLSAQERALIAHCLISSLDDVQDDDVEAAWVELAEKRLRELESGSVLGISWNEVKKAIKG